ncbi:unnamed protein product [Malus baccata var. baccata]
MSGPSDRHFDLNLGEEAAMPSPDNIWRPSFISPTGPLTVGDLVMKNDMTAAVVTRNLVTPKDNRLLFKRSDEWLIRILWLSVCSVPILCPIWPNAYLLEPVKLNRWRLKFVGLFQQHLPSSSRAVPHNEAPNDQPSIPPPSVALPTAEALPTTKTSPKQPL